MHMVGLMAFLKILSMGPPQKLVAYGKYLEPGGFDFYNPLKLAAHSATVDGEAIASLLASLEEISIESRRKYNTAAVKALGSWMKKTKPEQYFDPPAIGAPTPFKFFSVKLEPAFGVVLEGQRRLVHVWFSKNTNLSKTAVHVGNWLVRKNLCTGPFEDCRPGILDLRKKALLTMEGDPLAMDLLVSSEFDFIDKFFKAYEGPAKLAVTAWA
jgi:hypothetical protein